MTEIYFCHMKFEVYFWQTLCTEYSLPVLHRTVIVASHLHIVQRVTRQDRGGIHLEGRTERKKERIHKCSHIKLSSAPAYHDAANWKCTPMRPSNCPAIYRTRHGVFIMNDIIALLNAAAAVKNL